MTPPQQDGCAPAAQDPERDRDPDHAHFVAAVSDPPPPSNHADLNDDPDPVPHAHHPPSTTSSSLSGRSDRDTCSSTVSRPKPRQPPPDPQPLSSQRLPAISCLVDPSPSNRSPASDKRQTCQHSPPLVQSQPDSDPYSRRPSLPPLPKMYSFNSLPAAHSNPPAIATAPAPGTAPAQAQAPSPQVSMHFSYSQALAAANGSANYHHQPSSSAHVGPLATQHPHQQPIQPMHPTHYVNHPQQHFHMQPAVPMGLPPTPMHMMPGQEQHHQQQQFSFQHTPQYQQQQQQQQHSLPTLNPSYTTQHYRQQQVVPAPAHPAPAPPAAPAAPAPTPAVAAPSRAEVVRGGLRYSLSVRQHPQKARMCGYGERADRRPVDPPPILQLQVTDAGLGNESACRAYLNNPFVFIHAQLQAPTVPPSASASTAASRAESQTPSNSSAGGAGGGVDAVVASASTGAFVAGSAPGSPPREVPTQQQEWSPRQYAKITAGSVVSSMFRLKDLDGEDGAFFVFNDVSVRTEGVFRLCFTLYEVTGLRVRRLLTTYSGDFTIFAPKRFPGLEESTALTRSFADQGLKIRARRTVGSAAESSSSAAPGSATAETNLAPAAAARPHKRRNTQTHIASRTFAPLPVPSSFNPALGAGAAQGTNPDAWRAHVPMYHEQPSMSNQPQYPSYHPPLPFPPAVSCQQAPAQMAHVPPPMLAMPSRPPPPQPPQHASWLQHPTAHPGSLPAPTVPSASIQLPRPQHLTAAASITADQARRLSAAWLAPPPQASMSELWQRVQASAGRDAITHQPQPQGNGSSAYPSPAPPVSRALHVSTTGTESVGCVHRQDPVASEVHGLLSPETPPALAVDDARYADGRAPPLMLNVDEGHNAGASTSSSSLMGVGAGYPGAPTASGQGAVRKSTGEHDVQLQPQQVVVNGLHSRHAPSQPNVSGHSAAAGNGSALYSHHSPSSAHVSSRDVPLHFLTGPAAAAASNPTRSHQAPTSTVMWPLPLPLHPPEPAPSSSAATAAPLGRYTALHQAIGTSPPTSAAQGDAEQAVAAVLHIPSRPPLPRADTGGGEETGVGVAAEPDSSMSLQRLLN